jgi:hypothetical protein
MKLLSDIEHGEGRKISFSDVDDWGYTGKGIVFITDKEYQVTGLELYSARYGVIRFDQNGKITYCHGWEKDHVKEGIGVSSHFATKLIDNEQESHELFDKIYNHIDTTLKTSYLRQTIHDMFIDKRQIKLDPAFFNEMHKKTHEKSVYNDPSKKSFLGKLWTK